MKLCLWCGLLHAALCSLSLFWQSWLACLVFLQPPLTVCLAPSMASHLALLQVAAGTAWKVVRSCISPFGGPSALPLSGTVQCPPLAHERNLLPKSSALENWDSPKMPKGGRGIHTSGSTSQALGVSKVMPTVGIFAAANHRMLRLILTAANPQAL